MFHQKPAEPSTYTETCEEYIREIKSLEQSFDTIKWQKQRKGDIVTYEHPSLNWKMEHHLNYGVKTWTYTSTEETEEADKKAGRVVGTDKRAIIKFVNHNDYDFIRTEDFLTRGNLACDAFLHQHIKEKYGLTSKQQDDFKVWLADKKSKFDFHIYQECRLDINEMKGLGNVEYYRSRRRKARTLIATLLVDMAEQIKILNPNAKIADIIADLELAEKYHVIDRGRPAFIKVGQLSEESDVKMISAQFPQGEQTVPSSYRFREYENARDALKGTAKTINKWLSNDVVDVTAVLRGKDNNLVVTPEIEVIGHSSYSPISVTNELKRRDLAYRAVLENITNIAAKQLRDTKDHNTTLGNIDNPIPISLSTMMLLTPFVNKQVDHFIRKTESEVNQVAESALALDMLRYQKQPIKLPGKDLYVRIDLSYMNIPVNVGKKEQNILSENNLQKRINTRGFHEYCLEIENGIKGLEKTNLSVKDDFLYIRSLAKVIQGEFDNNEKLKVAMDKLNNSIKKTEGEFIKLQQSVQENLQKYLAAKTPKDKKFYFDAYKADRAAIVKLEKRQHKNYVAVKKQRKKIFKQNKDNIELLHDKIKTYLATHPKEEDKNYCLLLQRFLRAQDMFYNKKYQKDLYHFQINYLLSNAQIKRNIEAFCKSAEDRTGWCRISLLAYQAFNHYHGRDPDINDAKDKALYEKYLVSARQLSASIENTEQNSDARGPQVEAETTGIADNVISRLSAQLAKQVFIEAMEIANKRFPHERNDFAKDKQAPIMDMPPLPPLPLHAQEVRKDGSVNANELQKKHEHTTVHDVMTKLFPRSAKEELQKLNHHHPSANTSQTRSLLSQDMQKSHLHGEKKSEQKDELKNELKDKFKEELEAKLKTRHQESNDDEEEGDGDHIGMKR